jgi:hypothetical protein
MVLPYSVLDFVALGPKPNINLDTACTSSLVVSYIACRNMPIGNRPCGRNEYDDNA